MFLSKLSDFPSRGDCLLHRFPNHSELELRNPKAKNAISIQMMAQLHEIVAQLEDNPPTCLIIFGDELFCSGGDLQDVRHHLMDEASEMSSYMTDLLDRVKQLPSFIIAAVDGAAIGGGAEICTVADYVICNVNATIGFVHARLGVSPGWGGAKRLISKVGKSQALYLLTTAERYDAGTLERMRLVDQISRNGTAVETARELVNKISFSNKEAVQSVIQIVKQNACEKSAFVALWGSKSHRQALGLDE